MSPTSKVIRLSQLEADRDQRRQEIQELFDKQRILKQQLQDVQKRMDTVESELGALDADIDNLENEIQRDRQQVVVKSELPSTQDVLMTQQPRASSLTPPDEILTDPRTQNTQALPRDDAEEEVATPLINPLQFTQTHRVTPTTRLRTQDSTLDAFFKPPSTVNSQPLRKSMPCSVPSGGQYPWTARVQQLLRQTFRIESFRDQQEDVINATLSGKDVFCIMRTGGGKSLTYQLPSLVEEKKITLVISPLLSLIQDQEEQMNAFAPGSATSFVSGIPGGNAEHTRRWNRVLDPNGRISLIFCTPERVSKSNKLCNQLEKLHAAGRLGRFVIDECHCACQWGHDFRPDYTQLGKLKAHFPSIPVLAVTATASDTVREDVCRILRLSGPKLFRSSANRPNLTYRVVPKAENTKTAVIESMAAFIKENHPTNAGIVYTMSRKDADRVASDLCDAGIVAKSYHSDVSPTKKLQVHASWMRNDTQVVVATIAFGLGINKPDVRFVLHHCISKTLEAYYQESGRAGRDGLGPTDCVLFYSPKDVVRMLKMVHGTSSEQLLWPMVRYAQQSGNDEICRAIMMKHLCEPNCPDPGEVVRENAHKTTSSIDIGKHAKTVVQLLITKKSSGKDLTLAMLIKEWRATGAAAEQIVKDNTPRKEGLTGDDCERIVVSMLLSNILATDAKWTAYDTIVYLVPTTIGRQLLATEKPVVLVDLPKKQRSTKSDSQKKASARKTISSTDEGWIESKSRKRKAKPTKDKKPNARRKYAPTTNKRTKKTTSQVISLLNDVDTPESKENDPLWSDMDDSDECEFIG